MDRDILISHLRTIFTFINAKFYGKEELVKIAHLNKLTFPSWCGGKAMSCYIFIVCKTFNEKYF
jgi:hypothetical protein